jgi:phage repressor protein C with HTH and peptisase S24 domain
LIQFRVHSFEFGEKKFATEARGHEEKGAMFKGKENATVKRFYKETDRIRLESSNPAYEPICTQNCQIAGIVVGLMRKI